MTAPRPALFPLLPVLEDLKARVVALDSFRDVFVVGVQHLLATTGSLVEALMDLGVQPHRMIILGKCYSTCPEVADRLRQHGLHVRNGAPPSRLGEFAKAISRDVLMTWKEVAEEGKKQRVTSIIVLDDGGHCLRGIPNTIHKRFRIVGVEQTTSGVNRTDIPGAFPIINVAQSAAKQYVESPMIADVVLKKLAALGLLGGARLTFGVLGLGRVGRAVMDQLFGHGHAVVGFDTASKLMDGLPRGSACTGLQDVISKADVMLGCSGQDVFDGARWVSGIHGHKTFVSCSTGDTEFRTLLKMSQDTSTVLGTVEIRTMQGTLRVLRGGFPINFDGSHESVRADGIQLTRGLLLGGLLQASLRLGSPKAVNHRWEKLHPAIQQFVVRRWRDHVSGYAPLYSSDILQPFDRIDWIKESSWGDDANYETITRLLKSSDIR